MARYEDALICDLAETYGIYDYQALPPETVATLVVGLRSNSRVKMSVSDMKVSEEMLMLAHILDVVNILAWQRTRDAEHGRNRPKSVVRELVREQEENQIKTFDSLDDFKAAWNGE